jgi:hypothetical protein
VAAASDDPFAVPEAAPLVWPRRLFVGLAAAVLFGCSGGLWLGTQMPGPEGSGALPELDEGQRAAAARMDAVVTRLAVDIGERNLTRAPRGLAAAADYLEAELGALGLTVRRLPVETPEGTAWNLEAVVPPVGPSDGRLLVVGAHYDTAHKTPGADDNGSGVAVLLELARRFVAAPTARELRLVAFTNEEPPWFRTPLMGSTVYADALAAGGADVAAMFSLETLGWYDDAPGSQLYPFPFDRLYPDTGNFLAFVGDHGSLRLVRSAVRAFRTATAVPAEGVYLPPVVEGLDWSDHAPFWRHGWAAVMVTDTAPFRNPHYHRTTDTRVDTARMARVLDGVEAAVRATAAD